MQRRRRQAAILIALFIFVTSTAGADERVLLQSGWSLQSSAKVAAKGDAISRVGFATDGWHQATVPNTVAGALTEDGTFKDPYFGMNLRAIPGTSYPIGKMFANLPMPGDSPYKASWWYRTEFDVPAGAADRRTWLRFGGINYKANVWVNGQRVADATQVAGAFRRYEFDVTPAVVRGGRNAVAVEVFAPEPTDLAFTWVDWNPMPADKNMGLWGAVSLATTGPIALRNPHIVSTLDLPGLDTAHLTVTAEAWNAADQPVSGTLSGAIGDVRFSKPVSLKPREHALVTFGPADTPGLNITQPRVWWPYRMGAQPLYTLALSAETGGSVSDQQEVRFGIQQSTSELTAEGHRLFKINGRPILIRGGGWAPDMMLRPKSPEHLAAEFRYVKEMGLNTIRLEGKLESDEFYELADREGILVMPGWCCCDQWEKWDKWDKEDHEVAASSQRDQILRLRNHPSVFVWLNGSDNPPPKGVEQRYLDVLKDLAWSKPVVSNATDQAGPVSGPSGVKMRGPYDYVPPSYWLTDKKNGGAFGFATEIGPGAAVPPIDSLRRMLPGDHLWPIDDAWRYHAGGGEFKDIGLFTTALESRYGKATGVEDYARKAQALAYEGQRAMFEGYARNKYTSTGVIQWMLNNAWPSMIWHLYDYYLRPAGGYYGTKKACEPVHVQYSYDDRSIVVVNDTPEPVSGVTVKAAVFDLGLAQKFSREATIDVPADGVVRALALPEPIDLTKTYFVRLALVDRGGKTVSRNFYWLSTHDDVIDWANTKWYYTPTKVHADLTALASLPATTLTVNATSPGAGSEAMTVAVENTGQALAFQVHLVARDPSTGEEILPVFWEDNYFELFPGERREVRVSWPAGAFTGAVAISAEAWNAARGER